METVKRDCERDKWMNAEESVAYGVVDGVLRAVPDSMASKHEKDDGPGPNVL